MKIFLIPVDFSDVSYTAAQYALDLAAHLKAEQVILYHSLKASSIDASQENDEDPYHNAAIKHLQQMVGKLVVSENIRSKLKLIADHMDVKNGVEAIVQNHKVSLIVMGVAGLSDIENTLIGRNTLAVASSGIAPLFIIPRNHLFQPVKKAVYATDLQEVEKTTPINNIHRIISQLDAELHVVHVDYASQNQSPATLLYQKQLLRYLTDLNPIFEIVNDHKDKAYGIFDYVKKHDIDLIIMASRNYGFFERVFHSSVSKKLLNIADVPVVLLKNKPSV